MTGSTVSERTSSYLGRNVPQRNLACLLQDHEQNPDDLVALHMDRNDLRFYIRLTGQHARITAVRPHKFGHSTDAAANVTVSRSGSVRLQGLSLVLN
jgi:hypothetical protein